MKIPKQVKIAGYTYKVKYYKILPYKNGNGEMGHCDNNLLEIRIATHDPETNRKLPTQFLEQTFYHELLHAIDNAYNADSLEEEQVTRLSEGLYQVIKELI